MGLEVAGGERRQRRLMLRRSGVVATVKIPSKGLWHSLNVPLPRAPSKRGRQHGLRPVCCAALFTTKVAARAGVEAPVEAGFKRTAQPAGPPPCWSSRSEGAECRGSKLPCGSLDGTRKPSSARLRPGRARGRGIFKGCQWPLRRGYSAFEDRLEDSDATFKTESRKGEMLVASRFSANNGRRQALGGLSRKVI